jgi:hypothetical protein
MSAGLGRRVRVSALVIAFTIGALLTFWWWRSTQLPTEADPEEFCAYWAGFPPDSDDDTFSEKVLKQQRDSMAELGTPADAPEPVREGLRLRVEWYDELLDGGGGGDPTNGDQEAWFAFEDYVAETCSPPARDTPSASL